MALFPRKLAADESISRDMINRLIDAVAEVRGALRNASVDGEFSLNAGRGAAFERAASPLALRRSAFGTTLSIQAAEYEELVELVTDLHIGGSATAKVLTFDGTSWTDAETEELTVRDAIGTFEGVVGARALVRFHRRSGQWIVWQLRC